MSDHDKTVLAWALRYWPDARQTWWLYADYYHREHGKVMSRKEVAA